MTLLVRVFAVWAACVASGQEPSTSPLRLELLSVGGAFRGVQGMPLVWPFERFLRSRSAELEFLAAEEVPAYFNQGLYRFQLPAAGAGAPAPAVSSSTVAILETRHGFFLLTPAQPGLLEEFERSVASEEEPRRASPAPRLERRTGSVLRAGMWDGEVVSVSVQAAVPAAFQWRRTTALVYRLRREGRPFEAVFLYRTLGGASRLATALEAARRRGGAVVAGRQSLPAEEEPPGFEARAWLEVLERMGLKVSGVGGGEMRHLGAVEAYRRERPDGIRFVSANLVRAGSTSVTPFPAYVVLDVGAARVAFLGLTSPSWSKHLARGRLKELAILDPARAAAELVPELRARADLVVALSPLKGKELERLRRSVRGIDLFLSEDAPRLPPSGAPRTLRLVEPSGEPMDAPAWMVEEFAGSLARLELELSRPDSSGLRRLELRESHQPLDESVPDAPNLPGAVPDPDAVSVGTGPVLIPSARRIFLSQGYLRMGSEAFWTLAASLAAERTGAELGVLPIWRLPPTRVGDYGEEDVRRWFLWDDALVTFELSGRDLLELLDEVRKEGARGEEAGADALPVAVSGVDSAGRVHRMPVEPEQSYRIAGSELLLGNADAYPVLARARDVRVAGGLREEVIAGLRSAAARGWPPARYKALMEGSPVLEPPLWRVHFRDVSLNFSNTRTVKSDAFARVPNSRVQGFDQQVLGGTIKADADRASGPLRWSNALEIQYSRARLKPPGQPEVVNTPFNRAACRTLLTHRAGSFPLERLARSYGPSAGFQYEGEVEKQPGFRRKQAYSLRPGVELFDGPVLKTLELAGNVKRDFSRDTPNTQYGLHGRLAFSSPLGLRSAAALQGEAWANYFLLAPRDLDQDLRLEGDVSLKLQIPLSRGVVLAPFLDLYFFQLKVRPSSGYSAITGLALGFSRLWKPQYERF